MLFWLQNLSHHLDKGYNNSLIYSDTVTSKARKFRNDPIIFSFHVLYQSYCEILLLQLVIFAQNIPGNDQHFVAIFSHIWITSVRIFMYSESAFSRTAWISAFRIAILWFQINCYCLSLWLFYFKVKNIKFLKWQNFWNGDLISGWQNLRKGLQWSRWSYKRATWGNLWWSKYSVSY